MQLACDDVVPDLGCDYVASGETAEAVHSAMMAHGAQAHSNLMDGMTEAEMQTAGAEMSAHIHELIASTN